jgi:homopolymeric O-antigen transport system permease protein
MEGDALIQARSAQVRPGAVLRHAAAILRDFIISLAILGVAHIIAIQFRQQLPFGGALSPQYDWYSWLPFEVCADGLAIAYVPRLLAEGLKSRASAWQLWSPVLGTALSVIGITFLLPDRSWLETGYFVAVSLLLIVLIVPRASTSELTGNLTDHLKRLWANRSLLRIWVQFNVQSRYAQAVLGILWIVLLPLSQALIMTAVFSQILRISAGDVPFIAFFLAGLVPWGLFNQAIYSGMRSILNAMGLITQINFPREIIVLSALGEAMIDTLFMFIAMLGINAFVGVLPNIYFVWLPVLLLIQLCMMAGLMFLVSWLSVLIRDVPQLVSVFLQVLFYLCPVIYPENIVPEQFRFIFVLNPLASLIEGYRNVIVYNRPPDLMTLVYPAALAIGLLVCGYRLFKANEDTFADMV